MGNGMGMGTGMGTLPHTALCCLAGECHLSSPPRLQPARAVPAGSGRCQAHFTALPPARSAFESPCPKPGSGEGRKGRLPHPGAGAPQRAPHVVRLVGRCNQRVPGRALLFAPLHKSSAGATPQPGPGPLEAPVCSCRVSLAPCQGAAWGSGAQGRLVGPLPTAAPGAVGDEFLLPLAKLPWSLREHGPMAAGLRGRGARGEQGAGG